MTKQDDMQSPMHLNIVGRSTLLKWLVKFLPCTVAVLASGNPKPCPPAHWNVFLPWSCRQELSQGLCLTLPQSAGLCFSHVEQNISICQVYGAVKIPSSLGLFKVRDHGLKGVDSHTPYTML